MKTTTENPEPAIKTTPNIKTAARTKGKVFKDVTDLKSFLAKKKLEPAEKCKKKNTS